MSKELNFNIEIDAEEKVIYISEECSSGAKYKYENISYIGEKIKLYLSNYYSDEIN